MANPYLKTLFQQGNNNRQTRRALPGIMLGLLFLLSAIQANVYLGKMLGPNRTGDFVTINKVLSVL
ncbi:MAG: hypothetical protein AAF598_21025, partial [Bacteroidota bacterium]